MSPPRYQSRVEPDNHPSWKVAAKPVIAFIRQKPRTTQEIQAFGKSARIYQNVLLNILAWLENRRMVRCVPEGETYVWSLRTKIRESRQSDSLASRNEAPDVPPHEEPKEEGQDKHRDAGEERPSDEEQNGDAKRRQKRKRREDPSKPQPEGLHRADPRVAAI